jgi:hypothetical protein
METTMELWEVQHRVIPTSHKFGAEGTAVGRSKAYKIIDPKKKVFVYINTTHKITFSEYCFLT